MRQLRTTAAVVGRNRNRLLILSLAIVAALLLPTDARGFACTWDGSSTNVWGTAANWSTCNGTTPQPGDTVSINTGTPHDNPILSTSASVAQITLTAGSLTVASGGTLTMNNGLTGGGNLVVQSGGTLVWMSGAMDGGGTTTIQSGADLNLPNSAGTLGRSLTNAGTMTLSSNGYLNITTNGAFSNSGTIDEQGNTYLFYGSVGGVSVTNTGTLKRTTSSGTATIYNLAVVNTSPGTISVQSGTLDFSTAGSSTSTGSYSISGGATLNFGGSETRTISGSVTGAGAVHFTAGTTTLTGTYTIGNTTISGGTVNFNQASTVTLANLTMTSGTFAGSANISITNLLDVNSGTMTGGGTTTLTAAATGTLDNSVFTLSRPFINAGTTTLSSNAYFNLNSGATFSNTGTIDIQHNTYAFYGSAVGLSVINTGTLIRSTSSGTATIYNITFTNTSPGTVSVQSGTLDLSTSGSSTSNGAFSVSGGAFLSFSGSATRTISGAITGAGSVAFGSGTTSLTGTYSINNTTISGGTVNFNQGSTQTFANLTMTSGTLSGSANINVTNTLDVNSGTMSGGGTTTLGSSATGILDSSALTLSRPFVNAGTLTMSNNGYVNMNTGAVFTNQSTGTVDFQHNTYGFYGSAAGLTIVNSGSMMRTTSSGTVTLYNVALTNTSPGTFSVQSGTVSLQTSGTTTSTGAFTIAGGSNLDFAGSATRTISGAITGAGNVDFSGGTTILTGTYSISNTTISGGTVNFNQASAQSLANLTMTSGTLAGSAAINITNTAELRSGTLSGAATFTIPNGSTANLDSSVMTLQRPFVNGGTIVFTSFAYFSMSTGATFTNQATGDIEIQHDTYAFYGTVSSLPFTNAGSITRTTGSGTATIYNLAFTNTGKVESQSGTLALSNYTQTAGQTILTGGSFSTNGTTWNINGGVLKGTGTITGTVSNAANVQPGNSGPGTLTIAGNYIQTSSGTLSIDQNGVNPGTDFDQLIVSGTVSLAGTIAITTGFTPSVTTSFKVIDKTGGGAVTGTFTGAPEGTVLVTAGGNYRVSYVGDTGNDVTITFLTKTAFNTVTPCRVADTRNTAPPALSAGATRTFAIAGSCGIPADAQAVAFNFTVVGPTNAGDLRIYPGGATLPVVSALNYKAGQTRANNAIVLLGPLGDINIKVDQGAGTVHVIIDVTGYFQ